MFTPICSGAPAETKKGRGKKEKENKIICGAMPPSNAAGAAEKKKWKGTKNLMLCPPHMQRVPRGKNAVPLEQTKERGKCTGKDLNSEKYSERIGEE